MSEWGPHLLFTIINRPLPYQIPQFISSSSSQILPLSLKNKKPKSERNSICSLDADCWIHYSTVWCTHVKLIILNHWLIGRWMRWDGMTHLAFRVLALRRRRRGMQEGAHSARFSLAPRTLKERKGKKRKARDTQMHTPTDRQHQWKKLWKATYVTDLWMLAVGRSDLNVWKETSKIHPPTR